MKILYLANIPSPYRVDFFNELGKSCDLTVVFERSAAKDRDKSWAEFNFKNFKGVFLKGIKTSADSAFSLGVTKYLKKGKFDLTIIANYSSLTGLFAVMYMNAKKMPYIIEGDGGFAKSGKGFKERIKRRVISKAAACLYTADLHKEYYLTYGANPKNLYFYPFTSVKEGDILNAPLSLEEKAELRQKHSIKSGKVIAAVGSFIHRKGFDTLIKAAKDIGDINIYFIGGTADEEYLRLKENCGADKIHFMGFKKKQELFEILRSADLMVLPTREDIWGLIINEALACGLPVITTDKCIAGLELVEKGGCGKIVEADNEKMLAQAINDFFDGKIPFDFKSCNQVIRGYTIEEMSKRHLEIFEKLKLPD